MGVPAIKRIGIVGATSPLGCNLVHFLAKHGHQVYAGYRSREQVPGCWLDNRSIICVKAVLEDQASLESVCQECTIWVAHSHQNLFDEREIELNLRPFEKLLGRHGNGKLQKMILISSGGSVYGEPLTLPIPEEHPRNPLSSYGKAKKALEDTLRSCADGTGMRVGILRPGNIYGEAAGGRFAKGVVSAYLHSLRAGQAFTLLGHGRAIRDFIHIDDVSRAILSAIESDQEQVIWNVGTGVGHSVSMVLDMILEATGRESPSIFHQADSSVAITKNILSIERINYECGWTPEITIEQGIERLARPRAALSK